MADEPTIKIKLKTVILGLNGKPNKDIRRLRSEGNCKDMTDKEFSEFTKEKTNTELLDLTPSDNLGEALVHILGTCIKPDNNVKAAELFSYITKINNKKMTDKAEWAVTKDELKKFQELLASAKENISVVINGQVVNILDDYLAEIIQKSKTS